MRLKQVFKPSTILVAAALLTLGATDATTRLVHRTRVLPYCEVARNAERYHGQFVTVRARVILGSNAMYVFEDCDPVEALASLVEMEGAPEPPIIGNYVEEVLVEGNQLPTKEAQAIIAGRFDGEFSTGCWGPKFKIAATKIELVSPVTEVVPIPSDSGPRTHH